MTGEDWTQKLTVPLSMAVLQLTKSFPWLNGQIVNDGSGTGTCGEFKIISHSPSLLSWKDLRADSAAPTMATLRANNFSLSMLDEAVVAPRRTLPTTEESTLAQPVFLVQATFLTDGLLLTFLGQHNAMDVTGLGQVVKFFAQACREAEFTPRDVLLGNISPDDMGFAFKLPPEEAVKLDETVEPEGPLTPPSPSTNDSPSSPPPICTWAHLLFPATSLSKLKKLAIAELRQEGTYISTDDVITAFVYQAITRARLPRLGTHTTSTLARAVDLRPRLPLPDWYIGMAQSMVYSHFTIHEATDWSLGKAAAHLRSALLPKEKVAHSARILANRIARTQDRSDISFTADLDPGTDVMVSSWAKLGCYEWEFGTHLGKAEAVVRPMFDPVESLVYVLPKNRDSDVSVMLCLREQDMERMRGDGDVKKWATFIP